MRTCGPGFQGGCEGELGALERALRSALYRFDCPPPLTLGEFYLGLLDPTWDRTVDEHLRACPACSGEVRALETQFDA
ncbi:MAG: zf-HC2 domain-containing protein [Chloroflexi bacterium]|nr:zf-HC2 domain-containing protein [Chloroflexota bacterium]